METNPVVSIILPTYNHAEYLSGAVESVLNQTYQSWELIIWDDGSTDNTRQLIELFHDKRIRYFYEDNSGKSHALNQGIEKAQGEFIAFLDDDDRWLENKLSLQMTIFQKYPQVDLVFGNFVNREMVSLKEKNAFEENSSALNLLITQEIENGNLLILDGFLRSISKSNFIAFDSVVMKKEIIHCIGWFNENLRNAEDFEYWWRLGLTDCGIAFTRQLIMVRNKYPQGLSGKTLITYINFLDALDSCRTIAGQTQRNDTIPFLNISYRNAWQNLIQLAPGLFGRNGAFYAFQRSLRYGFSLGSFRLLCERLVNPLIKINRG